MNSQSEITLDYLLSISDSELEEYYSFDINSYITNYPDLKQIKPLEKGDFIQKKSKIIESVKKLTYIQGRLPILEENLINNIHNLLEIKKSTNNADFIDIINGKLIVTNATIDNIRVSIKIINEAIRHKISYSEKIDYLLTVNKLKKKKYVRHYTDQDFAYYFGMAITIAMVAFVLIISNYCNPSEALNSPAVAEKQNMVTESEEPERKVDEQGCLLPPNHTSRPVFCWAFVEGRRTTEAALQSSGISYIDSGSGADHSEISYESQNELQLSLEIENISE